MADVFPPIYISGYGNTIYAVAFDRGKGAFGEPQPAAAARNASFLCFTPDGRALYAVNEDQGGGLLGFAIGKDGALTDVGTASSGGVGPCAIEVSPDGVLVAAANYSSGSVVVYRVAPGGAFGNRVALFEYGHATGGAPDRQKAPHAHGVTWAADGRYLFVPDLGGDRLYAYAREADRVVPHPELPFVEFAAGSGPRHAAFSPDCRFLYVIHELSNRVAVLAFDQRKGTLSPLGETPTLPPDFGRENTAAEVAVHPSGLAVYASNRGHHSVAVIQRDPATGMLGDTVHVPVPAGPRHFALDGEGRWMLVAGQSEDRVAAFELDPATGAVLGERGSVHVPKPTCVLVR